MSSRPLQQPSFYLLLLAFSSSYYIQHPSILSSHIARMSSILNAVLGRSPAITRQLPSDMIEEGKNIEGLGESDLGEAVQLVEDAAHDQDDNMSLVLRFADKDIHDPDTILME